MSTSTEVEEAEANLKAAKSALNAARLKLGRYRPVVKAGALSQDRVEEAQLEVEQQEKAVAATSAKLQRAQATLNPTNAEVAIAVEQIAQEEAAGSAAIEVLHKEREALIQQQIQVQNQCSIHNVQISSGSIPSSLNLAANRSARCFSCSARSSPVKSRLPAPSHQRSQGSVWLRCCPCQIPSSTPSGKIG